MSIIYDFADIAARMNCKNPDERPVVFTGVECGSYTGMARLSQSDLPPYTPSGYNDAARQYIIATVTSRYQAAAQGDCTFNLPDYRIRL